ncbi:sensor histidine kinase [Glycomyces harbinensis]|uniref:histidine kinase n=1 Tax=Glycomyces harbinensis TaxID=58114 RepID=A0A1G6SVR2_9ACTN|nr:sensor domain-containing protein [Glycomyces harbinensis]SDD20868.1 Signal transduction histidine kinase [Glycomyces harbinensis]
MRKTLRQLGVDTGYLLSMFFIALPAFIISIVGFFLGLGTAVIWIGVPIAAATLFAMRGMAAAGRAQLPFVLRRDVARPRYKQAREGSSGLRRYLTVLTDGQSWLNLLWAVAVFPVAIAGFVITVVWWCATAATLLYPLYAWIIDAAVGPNNDDGLHYATEWLGWGTSYFASSVLAVIGGVIMALLIVPVLRGMAMAEALIGKGMLTSISGLHERIDQLAESRDAATSAEADALRRIERDIHDGPQQRLVSLGMELARVRRQLAVNPEAAQETLDSAISQTRETIDELRVLSRGIAPPILTDRGLEAALAALTARSLVPVELETDLNGRYRAAVESTVYFVTAECLTNVAKHSQATKATVSVEDWGDRLVLSVGDNGVGGAHVSKGHGLSGLADRVKAVEGQWTVDSPDGGPTVIVVEVPC